MTPKLLVLDVVGLTPKLLPHMPALGAVSQEGFEAELATVLPAVTCSAQATFLTGELPRVHGIVGNGWYFRDLGEPLLWRQHNRLVGGEKLWDAARKVQPDFTVTNLCWWYAMGASTDALVTPRPVYHADGRKSPDFYSRPAALHDELTSQLGPFPLFQYWGPTAGIRSSDWIARAAELLIRRGPSDVTLVYLPHLDYDLQRHGPDGPEAITAAKELDGVIAPLLDAARRRGMTVVALSEYGITGATRAIDINRHLRRAGLLEVFTQLGMEYLDPWASQAFAVADHQIAHVYVGDLLRVTEVAELLRELPGVDLVLDAEGKAEVGLDHERAGDLVVVAQPGAWFTYYYWIDDARAPDFARTIEIHRKPGYDPAELFLDPNDRWAKAKVGAALARKQLGFRYSMQVVPLDPSPVRGSHGRLPADPADGPMLLCSDPAVKRDRFEATEVRDLLLRLAGCLD